MAAGALLGGCGGVSLSQLAPSVPTRPSSAQLLLGPLSRGLVTHPDHGPSWMTPGAATGDLLYISTYEAGAVIVYSYPQDKVVGRLTGFKGPEGLCAYKKGDVWIVNHIGAEDVVEYKRGGPNQSQLRTLAANHPFRAPSIRLRAT